MLAKLESYVPICPAYKESCTCFHCRFFLWRYFSALFSFWMQNRIPEEVILTAFLPCAVVLAM